MIIISCALGIIAIALIIVICLAVVRADELDTREEELDKYSVHLDERANKLALWEQELLAIKEGEK